jgi:hypothetical protein
MRLQHDADLTQPVPQQALWLLSDPVNDTGHLLTGLIETGRKNYSYGICIHLTPAG